jgi:hypothetical protein
MTGIPDVGVRLVCRASRPCVVADWADLSRRSALASPRSARAIAPGSHSVNVAPAPDEISVHQPREAAADREPQAGAAVLTRERRIALHERLEQSAEQLRSDAGPRVSDTDECPASGGLRPVGGMRCCVGASDPPHPGLGLLRRAARHRHLAARRRELHRVGEQVHQHLPYAVLVADVRDARLSAAEVHQAHALRRRLRLHDRDRRGDHHAGEHSVAPHREPVRVHLGNVEHVVDQAEQVARARLQTFEVKLLRWRVRSEDAELEELRISEDRVERRAELVAHRRQELRLRARRRLGALSRLALGRVQPRVVHRDRRPTGDADHETLLALGEDRG